jgi:hypothetical protein
MRLSSILLVAPLLLALGACDGGGGTEPPPPTGGDFNAVLQGPTNAESAVLLELTGTGIEDVQSMTATVFSNPVSGGRRVVLVRGTPGTMEFRVRVAAGNQPPTARVLELAGADDQLRTPLTGYQVTFTRVAGQ